MTWAEFFTRPLPTPTAHIPYGAGSDQFADLWLPAGKGPFPVVVIVHGGCWRANVAKLTIMNYAAEDLRARGIAVWNIEYRGVDQPGGGYPGTFQDVAAGADALRGAAARYPLKLDRVVALGHSAGGHMVFWLAARSNLPAANPLRTPHPLPIATAISLGGLPDLAAARARGDASCDTDGIDRLVGAPRPDAYADTSPPRLGRVAAREVQINGQYDPIAPPDMARAYVKRMRAEGQAVSLTVVADMGHAELIAPGTAAWATAVRAVESALGR
jgi:acetyl esterase/lipase